MRHCLWSHPAQKQKIIDILTEAVEKHGYSLTVNLVTLKKEIKEFEQDVDTEIRVKHTTTTEELMPVHDEYFLLEKKANKFQGELISINQYRALKIDEPQVTNFYDAEKKPGQPHQSR